MAERSQKEVWRLTPWLMIFLSLGNFVLMAFDAREINTGTRMVHVWFQAAADFVQSPVTRVSSAATGYFQSLASLRSAQSDNDQLKQQVEELKIELSQKQQLASENERLREMLQLKDQSKYQVVTAQIIGRDPSVWFESTIVNRGSLDGVKLNMPVVTNGGLVGRITAVGPLTSQVDLITRDKTGLGAAVGELGTSGAIGVAVGNGKRDQLELRYVPGSVPVQVGEPVYTTGQDAIYPSGLKLGEVAEVRAGSAAVAQQIIVQPTAKLNMVHEVGILLFIPQAKETYQEQLPNAVKEEQKHK